MAIPPILLYILKFLLDQAGSLAAVPFIELWLCHQFALRNWKEIGTYQKQHRADCGGSG